MNYSKRKAGNRGPERIAAPLRHSDRRRAFLSGLRQRFGPGLALKLSLLTMGLVAAVTLASSLVVIDIVDEVAFRSLVQRGSAIARSAAMPAGYSILADDRLALDNLAARLKESQDDLVYVAILDHAGAVLAHDRLERAGTSFDPPGGAPLESHERYTLYRTRREGRECYEVRAPVTFADKTIGSVVVGIDAQSFAATRSSARQRIVLISVFALLAGVLIAMKISRYFTRPIKRLSDGVDDVRSGNYGVSLPVRSRDELGRLTGSFNEMARVIGRQKDGLESYAAELEKSYLSTIRILAASLDARDNYTLDHSARVARLSLLIGRHLGLSQKELKELEIACFLHDIGKIRIPDEVLKKQASLDADETQLVRRHPEHGAEILYLAESLHRYIPVVQQHHEWHDGSGYPQGLSGDDIHPYARIVAIADAYDAMTSSRPYRRGLGRKEAVAEIRRFRGTQFAPQVVDIFLEVLPDFDEEQELSLFGDAV